MALHPDFPESPHEIIKNRHGNLYINADGDISNYYPNFIIKLTDKRLIVAETKGREDLDVPLKMQHLSQPGFAKKLPN